MLGPHAPVAFVGSGLSTNFPSWSSLIQDLADHVGHTRGIRYFQGLDDEIPDVDVLLAVADECRRDYVELVTFLRNLFLNPDKMAARPPVFDSLVRAPYAYYITTNYDTNIEDAYRAQYDVDMNVATPDNIDIILNHMMEERPFLFKLHGCARSGGRFVIGYRDYQKIIFGDPKVRALLEIVMGSRPVVFLGYGHRDPHISSYLDYQRQRLQHISFPKFTYTIEGDHPFNLVEYYHERYAINCIQLDTWDELDSELNQYAYLQMRDRYERIRKNKRRLFDDFLETGRSTRAWDAVLYAVASSELGMTREVEALWDAVASSPDHAASVTEDEALALLFHTASGQMLKRRLRETEAEAAFAEAVRIAKRHQDMLPPLRALALRYAGIFALFKKRRASRRAWDLFLAAEAVLENDFPEELLDVRKWMAIYRARVHKEYKEAHSDLIDLAEEAYLLGYQINGAWCLYNAAREGLRDTSSPISPQEARELTQRAFTTFQELHHLQGMANCYLSLSELTNNDELELATKYVKFAQAAATLADNEWLLKRCRDVREKLDTR